MSSILTRCTLFKTLFQIGPILFIVLFKLHYFYFSMYLVLLCDILLENTLNYKNKRFTVKKKSNYMKEYEIKSVSCLLLHRLLFNLSSQK